MKPSCSKTSAKPKGAGLVRYAPMMLCLVITLSCGSGTANKSRDDAGASTDTDHPTDNDRDSDTRTEADSASDADTDSDIDGDTVTDGDADTDADGDTDTDADGDIDTDADADTETDFGAAKGGAMTFTNVGALGEWPRRLDKPEGDPACTYKDGAGHPGPWVAFVASELIRDGGRKWNGLCNCYSKTNSVGDGCGEINVFEVVMDNNEYSNREFISTGIRSFQAGHTGGSVCGEDCDRNDYPEDAEVIDACAQKAYTKGPEVVVGGDSDGCPVWKRPIGERYFMILLDEETRTIQVAILHPDALPAAAANLLPELPNTLSRETVDRLIAMRLPGD